MSAQHDFVRVFRPTAEQEWANRRLNDQPDSDSATVLAFVSGCLLGALVALAVIA